MENLSFKEKQKTLFKRQLELRKNPTEAELQFKAKLDAKGLKYIFERGFIVGDFYCFVDFYLPKPYKICFEIDGGYHSTDEQKRKDWAKDQYLKSRGFKVVRIKNEDVPNYEISL